MAISWEDDGIVLSVRRFGEHDAITTLLTAGHGRTAGLVKGGGSTRSRSLLQPGNVVKARWRARLDSQLGVYVLESVRAVAAEALTAAATLAGMTSLLAMVDSTLPEREPHGEVFRQTMHLLDHLGAPLWEAHYVLWELALLRDMGYGLDLTRCASTGVVDGLGYVSPRTGRAVSHAAAAPYRPRLLALPAFLRETAEEFSATPQEISDGLALTEHFFERHVFAPHGQKLPAARTQFAERFRS